MTCVIEYLRPGTNLFGFSFGGGGCNRFSPPPSFILLFMCNVMVGIFPSPSILVDCCKMSGMWESKVRSDLLEFSKKKINVRVDGSGTAIGVRCRIPPPQTHEHAKRQLLRYYIFS